MVSLTLSVPLELRRKMKQYPQIKWSEVVRAIIQRQISELEEFEHLVSKSRLTEQDVKELADKVDDDMAKHFAAIKNENSSRR